MSVPASIAAEPADADRGVHAALQLLRRDRLAQAELVDVVKDPRRVGDDLGQHEVRDRDAPKRWSPAA